MDLSETPIIFQKAVLCNILARNTEMLYQNNEYTISKNKKEGFYEILGKEKNIKYIVKESVMPGHFEDIISDSFNISSSRYYILQENNEHEGESWFFFGMYDTKMHSEDEWEYLFDRLKLPKKWELVDYNLSESILDKFISGPDTTSYMSTYNKGEDIEYDDVLAFIKCKECDGNDWYKGNYQIKCYCTALI